MVNIQIGKNNSFYNKDPLKPLLILDMDETLTYTSDHNLGYRPDFIYIGNTIDTNASPEDPLLGVYYVYKRPNLDWFLNIINMYYQLAIWSSGSDYYVNEIINLIRPAHIQFKFVWSRNQCSPIKNNITSINGYEKHLNKLENHEYDLNRILIVDDTPLKAKNNMDNLIQIEPWLGNIGKNNDLEILCQYLISIKDAPDFRDIDKTNWKNSVIK